MEINNCGRSEENERKRITKHKKTKGK